MRVNSARRFLSKSIRAVCQTDSSMRLLPFRYTPITSIDVVPVPKDLTTKVLQKKYLGIESDIIKQQRVRNKNNDFSSDISHIKKVQKEKIVNLMDDVRENDQNLFYTGVNFLIMAEDKKELDSVTETIKNIGNGRMCQIETHYYQQREAMNTILPVGNRQISTMRTMLTRDIAAPSSL